MINDFDFLFSSHAMSFDDWACFTFHYPSDDFTMQLGHLILKFQRRNDLIDMNSFMIMT